MLWNNYSLVFDTREPDKCHTPLTFIESKFTCTSKWGHFTGALLLVQYSEWIIFSNANAILHLQYYACSRLNTAGNNVKRLLLCVLVNDFIDGINYLNNFIDYAIRL